MIYIISYNEFGDDNMNEKKYRERLEGIINSGKYDHEVSDELYNFSDELIGENERCKEFIEKMLKNFGELLYIIFNLNEMRDEKYKKAFEYLMEYWDGFSKEQKQQINKDLNKIFGKNHPEYVNIEKNSKQ